MHRLCLFLLVFLLIPLSAYPQVTLSGAVQFSTNSTGGASGGQVWSTNPVSGVCCYALWLALNPDATSPVNGPSDGQSSISIPLHAGNSYTYYIFAQPSLTFSFNGLNLYFDGNNSVPAISAFGVLNGSSFQADSGKTFTLTGATVAGSGKTFYTSSGVTVVLNGYNLNMPGTLDVCQAYVFSPGGGPDFYGSFTLQVFPAASLNLSQTGGPPGTKLTTTGSGFAPEETVDAYINHIGGSPLLRTKADASGGFTISARERPMPYGPITYYAVGQTSGRVGAAPFFVTAAMVVTPNTGVPGDTVTASGFGFGAGEAVDIYWGNPRQLLGTATTNGRGTSTLKITIPANAPLGPNAVLGVGQTTRATAVAKVAVK